MKTKLGNLSFRGVSSRDVVSPFASDSAELVSCFPQDTPGHECPSLDGQCAMCITELLGRVSNSRWCIANDLHGLEPKRSRFKQAAATVMPKQPSSTDDLKHTAGSTGRMSGAPALCYAVMCYLRFYIHFAQTLYHHLGDHPHGGLGGTML
eukprot:745956-Prorocentrum_minimum.AAC.1